MPQKVILSPVDHPIGTRFLGWTRYCSTYADPTEYVVLEYSPSQCYVKLASAVSDAVFWTMELPMVLEVLGKTPIDRWLPDLTVPSTTVSVPSVIGIGAPTPLETQKVWIGDPPNGFLSDGTPVWFTTVSNIKHD